MELEATWGRAARVWWAVGWRMVLAGLPGAVIVGMSIALVGPEDPARAMNLGSVIWGIGVGLCFSKWMLNRDFGDFRLAVVPKREGGPVTTGASSSDPWQ